MSGKLDPYAQTDRWNELQAMDVSHVPARYSRAGLPKGEVAFALPVLDFPS